MTRLAYAVEVTPVPFVGFAAWCRDLPAVHAFGSDMEQALQRVADSMELVFGTFLTEDHLPPVPSALEPGERWASPSSETCRMMENLIRRSPVRLPDGDVQQGVVPHTERDLHTGPSRLT